MITCHPGPSLSRKGSITGCCSFVSAMAPICFGSSQKPRAGSLWSRTGERRLRPRQRQDTPGKIQSIYNGKCGPNTMQGLERAIEKPPPQEQWETMEKQGEGQWKQAKIPASADVRL